MAINPSVGIWKNTDYTISYSHDGMDDQPGWYIRLLVFLMLSQPFDDYINQLIEHNISELLDDFKHFYCPFHIWVVILPIDELIDIQDG